MWLNVFRPFKCTIHMIHLFFFVSEPPEIIKATEPDRTLDRICHEFDDFVTERAKRKYLIHGVSALRVRRSFISAHF